MLYSDTAERQTPEMRIYWNRFTYYLVEIVIWISKLPRHTKWFMSGFLVGISLVLMCSGILHNNTFIVISGMILWFCGIVSVMRIKKDPAG